MDSAAPAPKPSDAELLRFFLTAHDAICPTCGYSLRGLTIPRCPECSALLSLTVSSRTPAWPTGLAMTYLVLSAIKWSLALMLNLGVLRSVAIFGPMALAAIAGLGVSARMPSDRRRLVPTAIRWALWFAIADFVVTLGTGLLGAL